MLQVTSCSTVNVNVNANVKVVCVVFRCLRCKSRVPIVGVAMIDGQLYCKACFKRIFAEQGKYSTFSQRAETTASDKVLIALLTVPQRVHCYAVCLITGTIALNCSFCFLDFPFPFITHFAAY